MKSGNNSAKKKKLYWSSCIFKLYTIGFILFFLFCGKKFYKQNCRMCHNQLKHGKCSPSEKGIWEVNPFTFIQSHHFFSLLIPNSKLQLFKWSLLPHFPTCQCMQGQLTSGNHCRYSLFLDKYSYSVFKQNRNLVCINRLLINGARILLKLN